MSRTFTCFQTTCLELFRHIGTRLQAEQEALTAAQAATGELQRRGDAAEAAHSQAAAQAAQLQQELDHMRVQNLVFVPSLRLCNRRGCISGRFVCVTQGRAPAALAQF